MHVLNVKLQGRNNLITDNLPFQIIVKWFCTLLRVHSKHTKSQIENHNINISKYISGMNILQAVLDHFSEMLTEWSSISLFTTRWSLPQQKTDALDRNIPLNHNAILKREMCKNFLQSTQLMTLMTSSFGSYCLMKIVLISVNLYCTVQYLPVNKSFINNRQQSQFIT